MAPSKCGHHLLKAALLTAGLFNCTFNRGSEGRKWRSMTRLLCSTTSGAASVLTVGQIGGCVRLAGLSLGKGRRRKEKCWGADVSEEQTTVTEGSSYRWFQYSRSLFYNVLLVSVDRHKEFSIAVKSGKGIAVLLYPGTENRFRCSHSCNVCNHLDYRAHSIFLLLVLSTARWSSHHQKHSKILFYRNTKLFGRSARTGA